MSTRKRIRFVQTWSVFTWILFVVVVAFGVMAIVVSPWAVGSMFMFYMVWELSHICTVIDVEKGTITRWRGLIIGRLVTKKTRPLSEVKRPLSETQVKRGSKRFMNGEAFVIFQDETRWSVFFSGMKSRYDKGLEALQAALRGELEDDEVAGFAGRQDKLQSMRMASVALVVLLGMGGVGFGLLKVGAKVVKKSNLADKAKSDPCEVVAECCLEEADSAKARKICDKLAKLPEEQCRAFLDEARAQGKCGL